MANAALQAEPITANLTESERLYRAWRFAKAQWDMAEYDPAKPDGLDSDEESDAFCNIEHEAIMAYMLYPCSNAKELARKLRVFRDDQSWQYTRAPEIVERLFRDANRLAFGHEG